MASVNVLENANNLSSKVVLRLKNGNSAEVYLYGAHIAAWTVQGRELLFLSKTTAFQAGKAIRGGVPVCWPQFGPGALPQHGFARTSLFSLTKQQVVSENEVTATLSLTDSDATRKVWNYAFKLSLTVTLKDASLVTGLSVENPGAEAFEFTAALHTYFAIPDISDTKIKYLTGLTYLDKVTSEKKDETNAAHIDIASLKDNSTLYSIQQDGFTDAVVWNPWETKQKAMADLSDWKTFVCVEVANVGSPVKVAAGGNWAASQTLTPKFLAHL